MTDWHLLRTQDEMFSSSWNEWNRQAEEQARDMKSAEVPSMEHASLQDFRHVYEPSDDTYLLLDGLLAEIESIQQEFKQQSNVRLLEIGTGSGVAITYLTRMLRRRDASHQYYAIGTDINPKALEFAQKTAEENGIFDLELIRCDLAECLRLKYEQQIDVIIFNPPYVPTPDEEVNGSGIEASWAGGEKGRRVIDRSIPQIDQLLSRPRGRCYMITVDDNDPEEIARVLSQRGWRMKPLVRRRARNEFLTLQEIKRSSPNGDSYL